jgi:cellulose synthase/poly-beta-1,6-N-acetylglucosamine synthase-like glycosyltransferase
MEGIKFGWVAGYIREQSPFTLRDLCKQRRRWLNGIALLCLDSRVDFKRRALMFFCLAAWRLSWFCAFLSLPRAFHLIPCSEQLRIFSAGFTGCAIGMYLVGAYRNIQHLATPLKEKMILFTKIAVLIPFAAFVESLIVVYAVFRPSTQFYVVRKDATKALES